MAGAHTEATLNKLSKPELIQLLLHTEGNMSLQKEVKRMLNYQRKLGVNASIIKIVNNKLVEQVNENERQCWANAQYSHRQ